MSEENAFEPDAAPPWTPQQDAAYAALVRSGVVGLPTNKIGAKDPLWAHPMLWLGVALAIFPLTLLLDTDSPIPRRPDELLVLRPTPGDFIWCLPTGLLPIFLPTLMRVLASRHSELLTLQTMGDVDAVLPGVFAGMVRRSLAGAPDWDRLRSRFNWSMLRACALVLALSGYGLYVMDYSYRAVHRDGIREVTPTHIREYDWFDVASVTAECGTGDGWNWTYDLRFRSGEEFNLIRGDYRGVDVVARADGLLSAMGVPKRWEAPERVEQCIKHWPKEEERPLLRRILGDGRGNVLPEP